MWKEVKYNNDKLIDIVKLVIENGTEVNAKYKDGDTSLHCLCCFQNDENLIDIVEFLIRKGADMLKPRMNMETLHFIYSAALRRKIN